MSMCVRCKKKQPIKQIFERIVTDRLDQSDYRLPTPIYLHSCSHQTFRRGLQLK